MRIALLTESGCPTAESVEGGWCDRLTRGLPEHEFEMYSLGAERHEAVPEPLPARLSAVRHSDPASAVLRGRARRRALGAYRALVRSLVDPGAAAEFGPALYALADAGRNGGLPALLRSGAALRTLETAWQAPGAMGAAGSGAAAEPLARDVLVAGDLLAHFLRALSAPWYLPEPTPVRGSRWSTGALPGRRSGPAGLAAADLCHALGGGTAVLPGLLAKHFYGIPLIITEHSLHLRERARGYRDSPYRRPVRALLLAFFRLLAREAYQQAGLITPGSSYDQRWQIHSGAAPATVRVVYEGTVSADRPAAGPEPEQPTLAWIAPIEPQQGLEPMLLALATLRESQDTVRLRVYGEVPVGAEAYAAHCRALAAELFPDEPDTVVWGGHPTKPGAAYRDAGLIVFSGTQGTPPRLVAEAMLSGRPVVATDVGAAREVVGPTGLLVPANDPHALAAACSALLVDAERRSRLGNAGRLRAQELYAVEPAATAFRELYLELVSQLPATEPTGATSPMRRLFGRPAETWVGEVGPEAVREPVPGSARGPVRGSAREPVRDAVPVGAAG